MAWASVRETRRRSRRHLESLLGGHGSGLNPGGKRDRRRVVGPQTGEHVVTGNRPVRVTIATTIREGSVGNPVGRSETGLRRLSAGASPRGGGGDPCQSRREGAHRQFLTSVKEPDTVAVVGQHGPAGRLGRLHLEVVDLRPRVGRGHPGAP